jgi:hypothetical protein
MRDLLGLNFVAHRQFRLSGRGPGALYAQHCPFGSSDPRRHNLVYGQHFGRTDARGRKQSLARGVVSDHNSAWLQLRQHEGEARGRLLRLERHQNHAGQKH